MKNTPTLSRRGFLRGAGGIAVGLPWLEATLGARSASAQTAAAPKRFLMMAHANGYPTEADWFPTGGEQNFSLPYCLADLEAHRSDIVVLGPLANKVSSPNTGGHDGSWGSLFSGRPLVKGADPGDECSRYKDGSFGGETVDQYLAREIGQGTRFRSLQFGFGAPYACGGTAVQEHMVWAGVGQPLPSEGRPGAAFDRLFGGALGGADGADAAQKLRARKLSILDAVKADFESLNRRLGAADRTRLDQHLTHIREIERRLSSTATTVSTAECGAVPVPPASLRDGRGSDYALTPEVSDLLLDIMVAAIACDLTRVATFQWHSASGTGFTMPWTGFNQDWHWHHPGGENGSSGPVWEAYRLSCRWYGAQFGNLISKLKAVPEGDGSLLDNSVAVWGSDLGLQALHTESNLGFVLAGRCGGAIQTGRFVDTPYEIPPGVFPMYRHAERSQLDLYVAVMQALGINVNSFGEAAANSGPLPGIV